MGRPPVVVLAVLLWGCWGNPAPVAPQPAVPEAAEPAESTDAASRAPGLAVTLLPQPEPACAIRPLALFAARTELRIEGRPSGSWTDYVVRGPAGSARETCERMVRAELDRVYPADSKLAVALVRGCQDTPLAEVTARQQSEVWLVQPDAPAGDPLLFLGADDDCVASAPVLFSRFDSESACRQALARIEAARAEADREARAAAGAWLAREREQAEQRAERACARVEADREPCPGDPIEREPCELDRDRRARECQSAREMVELLRERERQSAQPASSQTRGPFCRSAV